MRVLFPCGAFPWRLRAVLQSVAPLHIRRVLALVLVALLGSALGVVALVCFLVFPLPPLPIQESRGLSSIVFTIELTVQCDGCLIWGLGGGRGSWLGCG